MAAAYASIQRTGLRARLDVSEDGTFAFELDEPGGYYIWLAGVHHKTLSRPLYIDTFGDVHMEVQLAHAAYVDSIDGVQVIGDFNDFSSNEGGVWMEQQADGTFVATVAAPNETLSYRLLGVQDEETAISGTHAHRYQWQKGGAMFSGRAGIFFSVLNAESDSVRVTFDPRALPRSDLSESVVFADAGSRTARICEMHEDFRARVNRAARAYDTHVEKGLDARMFEYDWSGDVAEVAGLLESEEDAVVRQYLLVKLFSRLQPASDDSLLARRVFAEVPPTSFVWSLVWGGPLNTIFKICRTARQDDVAEAYNRRVADEHSDPKVQAAFLSYEVGRAFAAIQKEKKSLSTGEFQGTTESEKKFSVLYDRLMTEFGDTYVAKYAKKMYAPDRAIQVGIRVPDFEVASLDDSTVTWTRDSLEGRVYLLDFWAVWCGPCVGEMPYLHAMYEKYEDRGFTILSLSFDSHPGEVTKFRSDKWKMPWLHTFVPDGLRSELSERFEVVGIPRTILVDEAGTIIAGENLRQERLEKTLADVFSDAPE
jgi:thiol-disulfide isomerase/thioredoxin